MSWHRVNFTNHQISIQEDLPLLNFVGELVKHLKDNDSRDVAIFSKMTRDNFEYYFSPKASELADVILGDYKAVECQPPILDDKLRFIAGDKSVTLTLSKS